MKSEIHLLIVWSRALNKLEDILSDVQAHFTVRAHYRISWSDKNFSTNLTRFYGQNLPPGSDKEIHCGREPFHALIVEDSRPHYAERMTSRGPEAVNVNLFDAKMRYREWTGGGHRIHGTNNSREAIHDLWLLLEKSPDSFLVELDPTVRDIRRDLLGADGWANLPELFETLNRLSEYVVLRNFECLPDQYFLENHGDIDLLVRDLNDVVYIANAQKAFAESHRVHYYLTIGGERIPFDFRYVGDNYYDRFWQERMLEGRVLSDGAFFKPERGDYFYSLLYHALIHKPQLTTDYVERIGQLGMALSIDRSLDDPHQWDGILADYLRSKNYNVTVPIDASVFYHRSLIENGPLASLQEPGDALSRVFDAIRRAPDVSSLSPDLVAAIGDPATEYHLSRQRHCLIRPLGIQPGERVLEIGCGCGALTRYLGEIGAHVVAMEDDATEGRVATLRCKDFPNVSVHTGALSTLGESRFDWILIIGADKLTFGNSEDVTRYLAPGGHLVVATENKLGLRYFNGCRDEKQRSPFHELQGLGSLYGRQELASILTGMGFAHVEFMYPFPDYKLPDIILTDAAFTDSDFRPAEMLAKTTSRDYTGRAERLFQEPLVQRELARNNLLADFANSFLVVASRGPAPARTGLLATSYAVHRRPEFITQTSILRHGQGITVSKTPLRPDLDHCYTSGQVVVRQNFDDTAYVPGTLALWSLTERRHGDVDVAGIAQALTPWFEFLLERSRAPERGDALADYCIAGDYQDCTPFNLVEREWSFVFIDQEWRCEGKIDLGWVVTRGVFGALVAFPGFETSVIKPRDVIVALCSARGISVADADILRWLEAEQEHQFQVSGFKPLLMPIDVEATRVAAFAEQREVPQMPDASALAHEAMMAERNALLSERDALLSERDALLSERDALLSEREETLATVATRDAALAEMHSSRSWRLTSSMRHVSRIVRQYTSGPARAMAGFALYVTLKGRSLALRLYRRVPLPHSFKLRLVKIAFRFCGPLFKGDAQYELWRRSKLRVAHWADLDSVTPATSEPDVIIFSIINWDFRTQRPQHLARGLARRHRVFFVEMDLHEDGCFVRKVDDNLFVVRFPKQSIGHLQAYAGEATLDQVREWISAFDEFCDRVHATSFKHAVIQHPFWWQFARHLSQDVRITFDCMDDIAGFSNTVPFVIDLETDMLRNCDALVVSSRYLFEKYESFHKPTLIRNAGQIEHFVSREAQRPLPVFLEMKRFPDTSDRIRVGYVGAIAEWFDVDLLRKAAHLAPDIEFHLCGAATTAEAASLALLDNVFMYGEVPYADVPGFLERMDVLCIPFQLLPIIHACDPVKFYEYSAMGKPTVATRMPELERAAGLVFFASTPHEFIQQIHVAATKGRDSAFCAALRTYAENNSWNHRAEAFEIVLGDLPKVSVVILSYGDPSWTAAALQSLYVGGQSYPNLETIVVDNGSQFDSLSEIHRLAGCYPSVSVIENGENLGFARGNNVGLKAATGEYILLLNNDTYVAPGAIHAMVRHLERNPQIGVVGPLTNNIGNEAKLFVEYQDMGEMKRIARMVTSGYRGLATPLNTLGYFAVMFRRKDIDQFGGLCEDYGRGMFEDDDHCALIRSHGFLCVLAEDAFIHHHLSATFSTISPGDKNALFEKNKAIFESKWGTWVPHRYRQKRPESSVQSLRTRNGNHDR